MVQMASLLVVLRGTSMDTRIDIKSLSFEELNKVIADLGEKSFSKK